MAEKSELLPRQEEQPKNPPPNSTVQTAVEQVSLEEAIRQTCYTLRINDDVAENIVGGVLARMGEAIEGGFDTPLRRLVNAIDPGVTIDSRFTIHETAIRGDLCRWDRSRVLAEKIASAIVAGLPGETPSIKEDRGTTYGMAFLTVIALRGCLQFDIVYTPERLDP